MAIDKQTAKLVARIAENLPPDMDDDTMQMWIGDPKGLQKFLRGLVPPESDLLKFIGSVSVEGVERLVVRDHLKKANVGWTGENFNRLFADKVEVDVSLIELNIHELKKYSVDGPIIKELGGEERVEIQLAHFLNFLSGCRSGWFVAYCRGLDGKLWAVNAHWYDAYRFWNVKAYSVEYPDGWDRGGRVLSRK